jgi:hypothetical protein
MSHEMNTQVEEVVENEVSLEEASAEATLKPQNATKSSMLSQMMGIFAGMKKEDLSSFLTKTLAQVGKEDETVPDTSAKNAASVAMKGGVTAPSPSTGAMKEDVQELFGEQEDLSEEFKTEASTLFEAAVQNRVVLEVARLEEEFDAKLEEQVTESLDELHQQVNNYMDYVVEKWMEKNEVAIANNFRVEATEQFIDGLKNLFAENFVEVPEEKVDMIGGLESRVAELEESLESVEAENVKLNKVISESQVEAAFDDVSEGLADTQVEKLRSLTESMEYDSIDEYTQKLEIVKKQYFSESPESETTGLITEEDSVGSNDEPEQEQMIPEEMKGYFNAISKTIKK